MNCNLRRSSSPIQKTKRSPRLLPRASTFPLARSFHHQTTTPLTTTMQSTTQNFDPNFEYNNRGPMYYPVQQTAPSHSQSYPFTLPSSMQVPFVTGPTTDNMSSIYNQPQHPQYSHPIQQDQYSNPDFRNYHHQAIAPQSYQEHPSVLAMHTAAAVHPLVICYLYVATFYRLQCH